MRRRRKGMEIFGLSFLDCICCGFGGVILLYTMTTMEDGIIRQGITSPARAEVSRIDERMEDGERMLAEIRNSKEKEKVKLAEIKMQTQQLEAQILEDSAMLTDQRSVSQAELKHANELVADIEAVKQEISDLKNIQKQTSGGNLLSKKGGGRQHYVTGLKVKGKRPVILFDCSASTVANSLTVYNQFYRAASDRYLLTAPKRVRMLDALDWLIATSNSPELQIILYNQKARFALPGTSGSWLKRTDSADIQAAADAAWDTVPKGGADLESAIQLANTLTPKPDNIYLITDGLPTLSPTVAGKTHQHFHQLNQFFNQAKKRMESSGQPLHVILFPFVGDYFAAPAFWQAAVRTKGSFFCPAPDWPN